MTYTHITTMVGTVGASCPVVPPPSPLKRSW